MHLSGEQHIAAAPETVWAALHDPAVLQRCLPGCESLETEDGLHYRAAAVVKVGPMKARFQGTLTISGQEPPRRYRLQGEARSGAAGFANGTAEVELTPAAGGTRLAYELDATVGGKIAQVGGRLIEATARKIAGDFFACLGKAVAPPGAETAPAPATADAAASRRRAVWMAAGLGAFVLMLYGLLWLL